MADWISVHDEGPIRVVVLNRPEKRNAINTGMTVALRDAMAAADADPSVRAILLGGAGSHFSAGADLKEFTAESASDESRRLRSALLYSLQLQLRTLKKPVVAAVRGAALGGGAALALACDMLVVSTDIRFGYPELKHGMVPTAVLASLVKQVGPKAAFELVTLTGDVDAQTLQRLGLASKVVSPGAVFESALDVASQWARHDPNVMAQTKELFYQSVELSFQAALALGKSRSPNS